MAAFFAKVVAPLPATDADPVYVVLPLQDGGRHKEPCRWRGGTTPSVGQECVMLETDELSWALELGG